MDINNPGLVEVEDEVAGNPDPNAGTAVATARELGELSDVSDQGHPPAANDPPADVFPTPSDEVVTGEVPLLPVLVDFPQDGPEVDVASQSIGQGGMVPVDPGNPAAGYQFRAPGEYIVVGPTESFQTNRTETDVAAVVVAAALDADDLPAPAGAGTTRFYLQIAPPPLTSHPVSLLGRQVTFAAAFDPGNVGAARRITNYGGNFVVIERYDDTVDNGDVPALNIPSAGDVLQIYVGREASEDVATTGPAPANIFLLPPPPAFVPDPPQAISNQGDVFIDQVPDGPIVPSGERVPAATDHYPAEQTNLGPGLPANVFT